MMMLLLSRVDDGRRDLSSVSSVHPVKATTTITSTMPSSLERLVLLLAFFCLTRGSAAGNPRCHAHDLPSSRTVQQAVELLGGTAAAAAVKTSPPSSTTSSSSSSSFSLLFPMVLFAATTHVRGDGARFVLKADASEASSNSSSAERDARHLRDGRLLLEPSNHDVQKHLHHHPSSLPIGVGGATTRKASSKCDHHHQSGGSDCSSSEEVSPPAAIQLKDQSQEGLPGLGSILAGGIASGLLGALGQSAQGPFAAGGMPGMGGPMPGMGGAMPGMPGMPGMAPPGMPGSGVPGVDASRQMANQLHGGEGMDTGTIIGITFGVLILLVILILLGGCAWRRMKKKKR